MPNLVIMHDQTGATGKDIITLPDCITPTEALMLHFPQGINPEAVQVFVGITRMVLPNEGDKPSKELLEPLNQNMIVVMEAKAIGVIAGINAWWFVGGAIAIAAMSYLTPKIPGDVGQAKQSPNNSLQGQTNIARPYQAYPLVFGSPVSYPDLTGEAIIEYVNNKKIVRQLMVVGTGLFDITETRAGATPLGNFLGSTATYYEPVNKIVTVPEVINVFSSNEVDGQEVLNSTGGTVVNSYTLAEHAGGNVTFVPETFTFEVNKTASSDLFKTDFDAGSITDRVEVPYFAVLPGSSIPQATSGAGDLASVTLDGTNVFYTIVLTDFNGQYSLDDNYDLPTTFDVDVVVNSALGPIKIAVEAGEIRTNIVFPRGLKSTVDLAFSFIKLDGPNGNPVGPSNDFYTISYTADTVDPQFRTYDQVLNGGQGYYQVTINRTDQANNDASFPDQTVIEAIYAINRETNVEYGNLTMLDVVIPATINATSLRENKINIALTSKLITYAAGAVNYTPQASRKFADAVLHLAVDFYGRDPNTLALDELYEIQDRLDLINPALGTFDFTFDDIDVSYDERMDAILQVARSYKWLDGDVYRFGRNELRANPATAITRRDISGDENREYSLSYNPQLLENFDSVKVEYVNKATNKKAYIFRQVDDFGVIIDGSGQNPKSLELAGCSEQFNAINRAELEMRTLLYQRYSLTDTIEPSAMFLDRGDMVLYAEQYNSDVFDGEILAVNGNIATVSESLDFIDGQDYTINYTTTDGSSVGSFAITPIINEPFKFQCDDLGQVFLRDSVLGFTVQTGSRYIISTTTNLVAAKWSILEKEARGRSVQLTMVNYDDRIYEFDGV
mgnify:CR=1 FL=1